jgi:hypothetical protein
MPEEWKSVALHAPLDEHCMPCKDWRRVRAASKVAKQKRNDVLKKQ